MKPFIICETIICFLVFLFEIFFANDSNSWKCLKKVTARHPRALLIASQGMDILYPMTRDQMVKATLWGISYIFKRVAPFHDKEQPFSNTFEEIKTYETYFKTKLLEVPRLWSLIHSYPHLDRLSLMTSTSYFCITDFLIFEFAFIDLNREKIAVYL
jgi:hypothetical protein